MSTKALIDYAKYDSYKDSGINELGQIPERWELLSNKHIFSIKSSRVGKKSEDYDLLSLTLKGIVKRDMENPQGKFPAEFDTYQEVKAGDFVFCLFDVEETPRTVGLSEFDGMITGAYTVLEVSPDFDKTFIYYFYLNLDNEKKLKPLYRGLRNTIPKDWFMSYKTFIPTYKEQIAIANFLDQKTIQIDQAINLKQQQIAKLNEYKQITIQNAVTKGLDANAKMKDSGIDWIDEIPENWVTKRLKYLVKIRKRIIGYEGVNVLSITQNGVKVKDITSGEGQLAMDYSKYQIVNVGDFAMNHMDLLTGYVDISKFDGVVSPDYRVFTNETDLLTSNYLINILRMGYKQKIFYKYGQGVSMLGRWRLPADNFNNFSIPIPSIAEQNEITKFIDIKIAEIDSAIELERQQIEQLKEYKTILINQAVTGKIKVC
jgi:type I restriction enzyme S subunit